MIRAISGPAAAAMLGVAAAALVNLGVAFLPLADLHAVHHPGVESATLALFLRWFARTLLVGCLLVAAVAWAGWLLRARGNLAAFGVPSRRVVDSVGRAPELRRRVTILQWSCYGTASVALVWVWVAWLAGRETAAEIASVREQARAGHPVDDALAAHLFGRELILHLPPAALFVLAAGAALLLIANVTSAQYGRVARLRGAVGGTIGP
ncbi:hypothetical protein ACQP1P_43425 [Dactylosporangium sp. CA-052675]|uniref:hypothetical protein n=1 Tax=Dactylosporangium sp. CA-052675 TaxID=3239927 RepID=UPI003D8EEDBD